MSDQPVRASTEDWCERSDEGHSWSYTHHAGLPRVETRTCMLCQFLSVEPVRELLRAAPAGTGSPTPAALLDQLREAIGDSWASEAPVGAEEAKTILDAVRAVLGSPTPAPAPSTLVATVARFVAADRAKRWRYDQTLDYPHALTAFIEQQANDENLLADVAAALAAGPQHLAAENARLRAELSQVQRERDAARESLKVVSSLHADSGLVIALASERDEARSALAALRAEVGKIAEHMLSDDAYGADRLAVEVDLRAALVANPALRAHHTGCLCDRCVPLRALVTDQSPRECSTCNGTRVVKCAAHIAGDGCEDLALRCPDCVTDQSPAAPPTSGLSEAAALLRETVRDQSSWLWFELGESALEKVADWLDTHAGQSPTSDTQTDRSGS